MKKYKIIILFIILSVLFIIKCYAKELPLLGKCIYIDAGHGGKDPGAIYKEIKEKDINLNYSKKIGEYLESYGAVVYYIRDDDYDLSITDKRRKKSDLSNRVKLINESKCDMYLSIHMNSEKTGLWYGPQVFYNSINKNNKLLAEKVQKKLKKQKLSSRKIALINNAYMYNKIRIPGILIEVGFLSNSVDRNKVLNEEYASEFSKAISVGIIQYFSNK